MLSTRDRRKKILINKGFQWQTTLIGLIYLTAVGIAVTIPFIILLRSANDIYADSPRELITVMNSLKQYWIFAGPLSLLALMAPWIYFSLRRGHGIVGPIPNMVRIINEFARGDFSGRVKLRAKDQLQDIAKALDSMAKNLSARERTLNEKLIQRIQTAKRDIYENTSVKKAYAILADLEEDIEKISDAEIDGWRDHRTSELLNN
jgi:methyl-accepting chemotaxis protein